ncbi:putative MATE family efflux protein [Natranaerovirga hydrolytica]|uniref:Probable multidrug resistance protein NorM n=1 Tax=Natranaerovirga hydrolytica TaxID=680378 RepID=A0A4R1N199_9FIRM|nr:MATE family efflux transporter [Natranaerovirga hydrolytica]TCK98720.1 putative MATE family efflux protein [Natranaerovirga hydrolytica]
MDKLFSNRDLKRLIIPIIIEQFLVMSVGLADVLMISRAGESAVSGVSLVDNINVLLINIFTALATGGAVIASQYIGKKDKEKACTTANQLILISIAISTLIMVISLIGNRVILSTIFGNVESSILENAQVYFLLSALSYPFLSIFNSCAGLFRSMGNSKVPLITSTFMNVLNVFGNAIFIFGFNMGVTGVGIASLISRVMASIVIFILLRKPELDIHIKKKFSFKFDLTMVKQILNIGIPNSLENSMFQTGKLMVLSLVSTFGTSAIAANAVSSKVAGMAILPGLATGIALITIVGQCVGADDYEQATYYTKKLLKVSFVVLGLLNIFIIIFAPFIVMLFDLTQQTAVMTTQIIRYHSLCCILIWPLSFTLPSTFRAAGDVRFPMVIAIVSMWTFRIGFSYVLGSYLGLGVFGIWIAMTIDWLFRSLCFVIRFISGSWKTKAT